MIDASGYRAAVGMVLINAHRQVFWARRLGYRGAWQFPQGGIEEGETPREAMFRELGEELGLTPDCVRILGESHDWHYYELPKTYRRYYNKPLCVGQKQKWFLLQMTANDDVLALDQTLKPEFDQWRWVDYTLPPTQVIFFKRALYRAVLNEFEPLVWGEEGCPLSNNNGDTPSE